MSDNITLPRELVKKTLAVLEYGDGPRCECFAGCWECDPANAPNSDEAIQALRTHLAAEQPKQEHFAVLAIACKDKEIDRLIDENEALRRDAERYRWLRDKAYVWDSDMPKAMRPVVLWLHDVGNADIDAIIDAAMEDKT